MKITALLTCWLISASVFGKIWIVDSNPGSTAKDFTNLIDAHNAAMAGDTLYLVGSSVNYTSMEITLTKRLVIIGPGYFLNENLNLQSNINSANVSQPSTNVLTFAAGSEGTVIMGVFINGGITVNANNILIKRNYISRNGAADNIIVNASNVLIVQNYIHAYIGTNANVLNVSGGLSGIIINNNYIYHNCANGCGSGTRMALISNLTSSLEVSNNIFFGNVTVANALVQNNLALFTGFSSTSSLVRNNSGDAGCFFPAGNGNNSNAADFAGAFVPSGTSDSKWTLGPTSQFRGTGFGGTDRGLFGGVEPYVLSGIPPIPTIYSLSAPTIGEKNNGLPVQLKVKSNN